MLHGRSSPRMQRLLFEVLATEIENIQRRRLL
jgi:hypothetical protein